MLVTKFARRVGVALAMAAALAAATPVVFAWPEAAGGDGKRGVRLLEGGGKKTPTKPTKKTTKTPRPVSWDVF